MSHVEFVLRYIGVGSTPKPNFLEQQRMLTVPNNGTFRLREWASATKLNAI